MFRRETKGSDSMKDIKISFEVHCIIKERIAELTRKTGKTVTIKDYIEDLVLKDVKGKG